MATTVTVDGIFESIPCDVQVIGNVTPKILGVASFESISSDPQFTTGIPRVFHERTFDGNVSHQSPVVTSTIKPDWRHPERKIG